MNVIPTDLPVRPSVRPSVRSADATVAVVVVTATVVMPSSFAVQSLLIGKPG